MSHIPALADIDFSAVSTPKIITCTIEGIVEQEDLQRLIQRPAVPAGSNAGDLNHIRERHHHVARLIASGLTQRLVATICNYTEPYLSSMLNAPAMQELVGFYRNQHTAAHQIVVERLRSAAMGSLERLEERLESDDLDNNELLGLAKLGLDRAGHGPKSEQHIVTEHHIFAPGELQKLNRAARRESSEDIIDITPKRVAEPTQLSEGSNADAPMLPFSEEPA